ncbi:tetraacyldisaccharide 4'-kinase [Asticcacaulis biprosthecium C19]|uniref:Tetraacyldisaccharide 4'-kinase n=1 Tax=Asticcacaulis biprosthecium C19 TaxID=715226 RepID=F4QS72_9CAUL|nr:tetraacyldisaccharide 4'-kinase [Asticcacaulis biprosthecium]EGF89592.1 tetraacyldisaccharide 4'-kinase [Asticcacaulis biprosthecium C19]
MAIRTPDWWYRRNAQGAPWWRFALWPLSQLWLAVNADKTAKAKPYRSRLKVISIGNVTLGGSGKSPIADEVLRLLPNSVGLSRGHGGSLTGPVRVNPQTHDAAQVGDEPLMLAQRHPFWIARDRAAGLRTIEGTDAITVVVDDAHQNLAISKDVHILVVDGDTRNGAWPFGDGGICPYGPLREPLAQGLSRADLVILWMPDNSAPAPELLALLSEKPIFIARLTAQKPIIEGPLLAFAGIAKPWKFEATLRDLGVKLIGLKAFGDHEPFSDAQLQTLQSEAAKQNAYLITTEKDWTRLPPSCRDKVAYLPIRARFDDEFGFTQALQGLLNGA